MTIRLIVKWFFGLALFFLPVLTAVAAEPEIPLANTMEYQLRNGLPNVFAKLSAGGEIRIGYIGGSITSQAGWRVKTTAWFKTQYPQASITEINAAIGGTNSTLGVFRLRRDILEKKPDLLFIEFAANDSDLTTAQVIRGMEGMVRQTWKTEPRTEICFVYVIVESILKQLPEGKLYRTASAHELVAAHYGIPTVNMASDAVRLYREGKLAMKGPLPKTPEEQAALNGKTVFAPDGIHPYAETGHQLYFAVLERALEAVRKRGRSAPHVLPPPVAADNWEAAKLVPVSRAKRNGNWQLLVPGKDKLATDFKNQFPELWQAREPGATLSFRFKGSYAAIFEILGPDNGQILVTVDDQPAKLLPNFDPWCFYHRPQFMVVAENLPDTVHSVSLKIAPEQADKAKILSSVKQTIDDPKRYDGTAFYPGGLLLVGDLVE